MSKYHSSTYADEISLPQIEAYLVSRNWINEGEIGKVGTVWHKTDSPDAEILLPRSTAIKDYYARIDNALNELAAYEQRKVDEVISDISCLLSSVISVRVISADTSSGVIPFNDGVLLISKARELLQAAAMSLNAKRKQFTGTLSKDAKRYVDSLLLGQTAVGSYVVNVIAPNEERQAAESESDISSVTEAVTHNLVTGLDALAKASDEYGRTDDFKVFDAAIFDGASSNMCDALLGFSGVEGKREFEIRVSGASKPFFPSEVRTFLFDRKHIDALRRASGYYKDNYVLSDREVWGVIKRLNRPAEDEIGTITIEALVNGATRNVRIRLEPDDYHQAVLAHDTKAYVKCFGDLHVKSKSAELLNPKEFSVVREGELF